MLFREDVLHSRIAQHVPVREIRLVRDKYTGEPRGFCFVQFHSVAHAGRALQLLQVSIGFLGESTCNFDRYRAQLSLRLCECPQNAPVEGQASTLRLCYAKERAPASGPAADALQVNGSTTVFASLLRLPALRAMRM